MNWLNEIHQKHRQLRKRKITIDQWWAFIKPLDKETVSAVIKHTSLAEYRLRDYKNSWRYRTRIRKYISYIGYSDCHAYEVIKVVSPITVIVRRLNAVCVQAPKDFHPGGFSGHYSDNHNQKWEFSSDEKNATQTLRLGKQGWGRGHWMMLDEPYEHYDYNF